MSASTSTPPSTGHAISAYGTSSRPSVRTVVASLWLFATLNYIYCDVLGTHDPEYLRALLTGTIGGVEMSQGFLLGASVLVSIPMASVLISRIAGHRFARISSIVAGAIMTTVQFATLFFGTTAIYYAYFSVIEIATASLIVWFAATRWREEH